MAALRAGNVRVVWIRGNHDAASKLTAHLNLPDNVRELSHKKPDSFVLEELGVAVHGQGFDTRDVTTRSESALSGAEARAVQHRPLAHGARGQGGARAVRAVSVERA